MWITCANLINTGNLQWEKVFITFVEMWMKKDRRGKNFFHGQG